MKFTISIFLLLGSFYLNAYSQSLQVDEPQRYLETPDGKPFLRLATLPGNCFTN
jgi:hypothetical protein